MFKINTALRAHYINAALLLGAVFLILPNSAANARDGFSYRIKAEGVYDTNPLTRSDNFSNDSIYGVETTGSLLFTQQTPTQNIDADLSITRNQFNDSDFNSNDGSLALRASKEIKRWLFRFTGKGEYDTTRSTEIDIIGRNNVVAGRRTSLNASPSLVFNYSPRNSVGLNTDWAQRQYASETFLTDHRTYSLSPYYARKLTRLQTLSLALLYQNYTSTSGPDVEVESIGPFLNWEYDFTPSSTLELSFGLLRTEFDGFGTDGGSETNPIYSAKYEHEGDRHITSLSLERAREASSNGSELDVTTAQLNNTTKITPRWDINFSAEYKDAEQSEFSTNNLDNSYYGSIGASYEITRNLKFSTSYLYLDKSFTDDSASATKNIIRAGIEYAM